MKVWKLRDWCCHQCMMSGARLHTIHPSSVRALVSPHNGFPTCHVSLLLGKTNGTVKPKGSMDPKVTPSKPPHHWPRGPLLLWDTVDHSLLQTRRESYLVYHPCSDIFQSQITHHGFTSLRQDVSIHTGRMPAPSASNHSWEQQASGAGMNIRTH